MKVISLKEGKALTISIDTIRDGERDVKELFDWREIGGGGERNGETDRKKKRER